MPADQEQRVAVTGPVWQLRVDGMPPPAAETAEAGTAFLRRRLLLRGFWAGAGVLAAGGIAAAADFLTPRSVLPSDAVTVPARDVPRSGGPPFHHSEDGFWLVNLKPGGGVPQGFPGNVLIDDFGQPSKNGGLLALSDRCPFQGCRLPWRPDFEFAGVTGWFRCPCCGGTFTEAGLRVFGPPPHSMDTLPILHVSSDGVVVRRGLTLRGGPDDVQRTVPAGQFAG